MKKFIYALFLLSFWARGQDQVLNKSGKLLHVMVPSDSGRFVRLTGDQRIEGVKNFADSVSFNNSLTVGDMWIQSNGIRNLILGSIAIGQNYKKISGENNISLGHYALGNNNNGNRNIAIGFATLESNYNGNDNIVIGYAAMKESWNESNNLAIGNYALSNNGGGEYNVAVGNNTLMTNPSWYSTAVGFSALKSSSFGISNTAVGSFALTSNTEGSSNTAMGDSALAKNTTGEGNIALGYQALKSNATGSNNIAIGKHTLTGSNDVGFYNIAIGDAVMQNALNTQNNVVIGHFAGQSIRAANSLGGSGNTGIGGWNFRELRFGSNNVALGYYAGDSLSTGSNNIAIGAYQKLPDSANELNNPNHSNRMNIGGLLFGKNMTGNFGNPAGQLGIGLTDPTARLEVAGSIKASDTLTANRIIRRGGTGSQVLLADGSVAVAGTGVALSSGIISSDTSVYERFVWLTKNQRIVGIKTFADTVKLQKDLWVNGISVGSGGGINSIIMGANQTGGLGNNRMNLGGLLFGTDMTGTYGSPAGNIGIGLTNPSKRLEVAGSIKASDTLFVNLIGVNHSQPLERIDVIGNIKASGALIASSNNISSDSRLKSNIEPITNALSIINQMRPVKYDKKSDLSASTYDYHEFGFLAQEMKAILPLLVSEGKDPNKLLSLNYTALIPVLTKALQEQQLIIEELIKRVEKLENR